MAAPPENLQIRDADELRSWLEKQPPEVAVAIAVRAALRVLPNLDYTSLDYMSDFDPDRQIPGEVLISAFHLMQLSWFVVSQSDRSGTNLEPHRFLLEQADLDFQEIVRHAFISIITSTLAAKELLVGGKDIVRAAIDAISNASQSADLAGGNGIISAAVSADIEWIEKGRGAGNLAGFRLWIEPAIFSQRWDPFKQRLLDLDQDWQVWINWYDARLRGDPPNEELELARAMIDDEIWAEDPRTVNRYIMDIEARIQSATIEADPAASKPGKAEISTDADSEFKSEPLLHSDFHDVKSDDNPAATPSLGNVTLGEVPDQAEIPQPPADEGYTDLTFLDDRPDTENDVLGRSSLAFMLAGKLNQVWDGLNREPETPRANAANTYDSGTWAPQAQFSREPALADGAFVVQVDAPWGGGKTTFANYLARFLNPYVHPGPLPKWDAMKELAAEDFSPAHFRRPWHIVQFNAWQHQHINPPWWAFYQVIRKQGFHGVRTDTNRITDDALKPPPGSFRPWMARQLEWLWLWLRELGWRLFNPKNQVLLVIVALAVAAALALDYFDFLAIEKAKLTWDIKGVSSVFATGVTVLAGGGAIIWTIISTATESLLPGTPSAAMNYSLGAGDPLERFRKHFAGTIKRLRRPVLVVIDDLDRCKPDFVVELVRGMQTILRSPRLVFLILGDRDWIEQAFAEQHRAMEGIDVGPEHSFGARFVEKAIQMSFVLPEVDEQLRGDYVKALLNVHTFKETASAEEKPKLDAIVADIEQMSKAPSIDIRDQQVSELKQRLENDVSNDQVKKAVTRQINQTAALQNATDARLHAATQHRIVPLSPILPSNPRQIKRIINAVSLYQEIARIEADIQPKGDPRWQQLAQWVVLMTEYPQTWFTLNLYPGLADRFHNPTAGTTGGLPEDALAASWLGQMHASQTIPELMAYSGWQQAGPEIRIDAAAVALFKPLMPATSGKPLPATE